MQKYFATVTKHPFFSAFILFVILLASALAGIETYPAVYAPFESQFTLLNNLIQAIFTIEIAMRILAYGRHPYRFFRLKLNIFDFAVTALFYLPFGGSYASVLRLVRILRVFRLITTHPNLQLLAGALIKSIPSIGWVGVLLFIQFYIYAIIGNFEFGKTDPAHFGNLTTSMMTLFQVVTLEGWVSVYEAQSNLLFASAYFISFIFLGTMITLNLFIGVILNGFDEVHKEIAQQNSQSDSNLKAKLKSLNKDINVIKEKIDRIASTIR